MPNLLILGVANGTGTTKCVSSAQKDGFLMPTKFVLLSVISVKLGIRLVHALLASLATYFLTINVFLTILFAGLLMKKALVFLVSQATFYSIMPVLP